MTLEIAPAAHGQVLYLLTISVASFFSGSWGEGKGEGALANSLIRFTIIFRVTLT